MIDCERYALTLAAVREKFLSTIGRRAVHERERWQVIKAMLRESGLVRVADVCRATGASEASVRRDFARLAANGLASRVHGGLEAAAHANSTHSDAPALATRSFDV